MHSQYDHIVYISGRSSVRNKVLSKRIPNKEGPYTVVCLSREYPIANGTVGKAFLTIFGFYNIAVAFSITQ